MLGPTTATSFMNQVETSPDPNVRYKAYQNLAARPGLRRPRAEDTRRAAAPDEARPPRLPEAVGQPRVLICRTLGELGEPVARDAMVRLCHDGDPLIRAEAYHALGKVGEGARGFDDS